MDIFAHAGSSGMFERGTVSGILTTQAVPAANFIPGPHVPPYVHLVTD